MNEHKDWIQERVDHQRDLDQRRAAWEQEQKQRKEQEERDRKQAQLESYLKRRGQDYMDHTGQQPPLEVLQRWQAEYMDEQELIQQAEREERIARAEDIW